MRLQHLRELVPLVLLVVTHRLRRKVHAQVARMENTHRPFHQQVALGDTNETDCTIDAG